MYTHSAYFVKGSAILSGDTNTASFVAKRRRRMRATYRHNISLVSGGVYFWNVTVWYVESHQAL
jgi:endonuclease/exonuclease/phosphatase (EEP) superfamily protein YafD